MDSQLFAGPVIGIFCSGLNAYCMQTGPLFLRISGSSGVLKVFLLERNRQLSCNPKKKKKKKDANMPQASPALVPSHFPDGAVASAMLLWAEDVDVPLDTARQAV